MGLKLNELAPAPGSKKTAQRRGRGIGSGLGKTGGRGVKGQKSRSGSSIRSGFEGGQMPLYRRVPKFGFTSQMAMTTAEVRLSELNKIDGDVVSVETLKAANIIRNDMKRARIILSGNVTKAFTFKGVKVTKGAKEAIEAAGGSVEELTGEE
ncbi:50S ribosomal protein L15 [Psychrobacter pygoscelis]|uniref:50S ribosomal protein L15 n=1 Tax=Psychrobacter pygoscelis TaxID=2488563 RepID=UPI00103874A0|nr:50S ribosomal protein L15 [Psychrobacter pygoscelis]